MPRSLEDLALNALNEHLHRGCAHLAGWLGNRGQLRPQRVGPLKIVEPDQRHVVWYLYPACVQGSDSPKGRQVIGREDGGRGKRQIQEIQCPAEPPVEFRIGVSHEGGILDKTMLTERKAIAV